MSTAVDGRQCVVIAAGGHGPGTKTGDDVIAYSLDSSAANKARISRQAYT